MDKELKTQQVDGEAEAPVGVTPAEPTSGDTMAPTTEPGLEISDALQALIDQRIVAAREEATAAAVDQYERADGHLAKLRSKKDKEIAALKKALREQQLGQVAEAKRLLETNPARAAEILVGLAEAQERQVAQEGKYEQMADWQATVLKGLGADPEDEEVRKFTEGWLEKMAQNPDNAWDFPVAAGKLVAGRERQQAQAASKELDALKESIPALIKAEITKAFAQVGMAPEPGPDGEVVRRDQDWRKKSSAQLISDGLAERMRKPIQRT